MVHIKRVTPLDHYRLEVVLENGSSVTLNLENRLRTLRFGMMADKEFFNRATTDGNCISWDGKVEISISEVFQLAQK